MSSDGIAVWYNAMHTVIILHIAVSRNDALHKAETAC
jgi:hypothetical protein